MKISIVIPCYNEAENITTLMKDFFPVVKLLLAPRQAQPAIAQSVEVVFVDDGSNDDTFDLLHDAFHNQENPELTIRFERHPVNRGLGAALRTGFAASSGDIIITTDSDSTYRYSEIPQLLETLKPDIDLVTASPYHPRGDVVGVPALRLILSKGLSFLYRILVNKNIYTYTSLFRAYGRIVIDEIQFQSDGFLAGTELLVKALIKGYTVAEYPTVLYKRTYGVSKAKLIRTIEAHLKFQWWILLKQIGLRSGQSSQIKSGEQEDESNQ